MADVGRSVEPFVACPLLLLPFLLGTSCYALVRSTWRHLANSHNVLVITLHFNFQFHFHFLFLFLVNEIGFARHFVDRFARGAAAPTPSELLKLAF